LTTKKQIIEESEELKQYKQFLRSYKAAPGKQATKRWHLICALWRRNNGTRWSGERFAQCRYCQSTFKLVDLTVDHVVPKSRGGKSDMKNLVLACEPCNRKKANQLIGEYYENQRCGNKDRRRAVADSD